MWLLSHASKSPSHAHLIHQIWQATWKGNDNFIHEHLATKIFFRVWKLYPYLPPPPPNRDILEKISGWKSCQTGPYLTLLSKSFEWKDTRNYLTVLNIFYNLLQLFFTKRVVWFVQCWFACSVTVGNALSWCTWLMQPREQDHPAELLWQVQCHSLCSFLLASTYLRLPPLRVFNHDK